MKKPFLTVRVMVLCAKGAACLTVCAWISIPILDIAFTLQAFGIFFLLGVLGGKCGTVSLLVYLFLGIAGLPVFSGFRGGLSVLLGVTGGYIWGFLLAALLYWAVSTIRRPNRLGTAALFTCGMLLCYGCGSAWFLYAYAGPSAAGLGAVLAKCVLPYLIPDAVKIALAVLLSEKLRKHLPRISLPSGA